MNQREIKFRVWLKNRDEMVYKGDGLYIDGFTGDIYIPHFGNPNQLDKMDDVILMQFTGLKDKNGKEIYSGDLLKYENNDKTFEVKWAKEGFWECDGSCLGNVLRDLEIKMEVVGNIFEK